MQLVNVYKRAKKFSTKWLLMESPMVIDPHTANIMYLGLQNVTITESNQIQGKI